MSDSERNEHTSFLYLSLKNQSDFSEYAILAKEYKKI